MDKEFKQLLIWAFICGFVFQLILRTIVTDFAVRMYIYAALVLILSILGVIMIGIARYRKYKGSK